MPGDKASSRDSAVIDDDLVEALGFEPLSTSAEGVSDTAPADEAADFDEPDIDEEPLGDIANPDDSETEGEAGAQSVVILGDTTPVDANDPVTSDIAAAILGDTDTKADLGNLDTEKVDTFEAVEEPDLDLLEDSHISRSESAHDEFIRFNDEAELNEDVEEVTLLEDLATDEDLVGGLEEDLVDEDLTDDASLDGLSADEEDKRIPDSLEDFVDDDPDATMLDEDFDPLAIESAFPDVPALDDSGEAMSKLEDRQLLTQPVDLDEVDLRDGTSVSILDRDDLGDPPPPVVDEPIPAAVGVAPTKGYRRKRVRAKKTRRVIRHIDPWSVLTFSVLFHLALYAAFLLASVLVWKTLEASGMVKNIEDFIIALGDYETYEINADVLFRAGVIIAGILTVASTILSVLLSVVFNLISDLVGGIRVTVLEEETVRLPAKKRVTKSR